MKSSLMVFLIFLIISCDIKQPNNKINTSNTKKIDATKIPLKGKEEIEAAICDTVLLGDINNDIINDTAYIYTPSTIKFLDDNGELQFYFGCIENNCYNKIRFSCRIPEIYFKNSVWGSLDNIGDLNNDGYNELIFSPSWFTSCWGQLYIYSFNGKQWDKITNVSYRRCEGELLKSHIIKSKNKYYLKGLEFVEGDDAEYKVEIKIK